MPEKTDHDVLIEHGVILKNVCKKLDKILDKIDDNNKTYITRKMFLTINGIIIALLITLFGYTANLSTQVTTNTTNITNIQKLIEK